MRLKNYQKNVDFVKKVYSKAHPNPMGKGVVFGFKKPNDATGMIKVILDPKNDWTYIQEIIVLEDQLRQGFGSKVLSIITELADKMNITLKLSSVPLPHQGQELKKSDLQRFYMKHGFEKEHGDLMIRTPK